MLVTGTSTGLGRALVELILEKGEKVVATARATSTLDSLVSQYPASQLLVLPLDVTKQGDVISTFARAKEAFGRIDIVVNNAGFGIVGETETIDEVAARSVFDTNVWGTLRVTKEAIRFFRDENPRGAGGRLLQIGSGLGLVGCPGLAIYSASKFGEFCLRMR